MSLTTIETFKMKTSQGTFQKLLDALAFANVGNQGEFEALLKGRSHIAPKRNPERVANAFPNGHFNHMPKPY